MAGFGSSKNFVDSSLNGQSTFYSWRKTPSQATTAGVWFDFSMSPGNPSPQYYAASPYVATVLAKSTDGGLPHGFNTSPSYKFLKTLAVMSASATGLPMTFMLADYLLFYPFVDTGTNDEQFMTNGASLTRYTDGKGVQMMAVSVAANSGTQPTFTVNYTNSDGTAGRTSGACILNTATANGSIITGHQTAAVSHMPFIPLQAGDTGVRSVQSVTFTSGTDVGLFALVLVKPLITSTLLEQTAPVEVSPVERQGAQLPRIYDDAFLSLITLPSGSLSGVAFHGYLETTFN